MSGKLRSVLGMRLNGVALETWITARLPAAAPDTWGRRRRANWIILAGLLLGTFGMTWSFSYPGFVAFLAAHAVIVCGAAWGRSMRHAALAVIAIAIVWLMPGVFWLINQLINQW